MNIFTPSSPTIFCLRIFSILLLSAFVLAADSLDDEYQFVMRALEKKGFVLSTLSKEFHYRGDTRGPEEIFSAGFRRIDPKAYPKISRRGEVKNIVAASDTLSVAVGFADSPRQTQGFGPAPRKEFGWVYLLFADEGFDVRSPKRYMAVLGDEFSVPYIAPDHIAAAIQIKTTKNEICCYCPNFNRRLLNRNKVQWAVSVVDFVVNDNFNKELRKLPTYKPALRELREIATDGYFVLPTATEEEKTAALQKLRQMNDNMPADDEVYPSRRERIAGAMNYLLRGLNAVWPF